MRRSKPIPRKRKRPRAIHPERSGSHHRVKLHGMAKTERRRELFERSGGRCEEIVQIPFPVGVHSVMIWVRCNRRITWDSMHWSHKRHAANKCDCMDCGLASCDVCHDKRHNAGGKPCPKKPSRRDIEETQGRDYLSAVAAAETELLGKGLVA